MRQQVNGLQMIEDSNQQNYMSSSKKHLSGQILVVNTLPKVFETMQNKILAFMETVIPEGFDLTDLQGIFTRIVRTDLDYGLLVLNLLDYFLYYLASLNINIAVKGGIGGMSRPKTTVNYQCQMVLDQFEKKAVNIQQFVFEESNQKNEIRKMNERLEMLSANLSSEVENLKIRISNCPAMLQPLINELSPNKQSRIKTNQRSKSNLSSSIPKQILKDQQTHDNIVQPQTSPTKSGLR